LFKRTSAYLGAVSLAAAGFAAVAAAPAASAGTGPVIGTRVAAGYQDYGRNFRYIQSLITVPDDTFVHRYDGALYPQEYIQLSNGDALQGLGTDPGDEYARAGIESCQVAAAAAGHAVCGPSQSWVAFVEVFNNSLNGPFTTHYVNLPGVAGGDGVFFSVYFNQGGNELQIVVHPPTPAGGAPVPGGTFKTNARGAIFDHAAALVDFTDSLGHAPIALPPLVSPFQLNSFLEGAVTTGNGQRGSFTGPWTTSQVIATSNGNPPPLGTKRAYPDGLYGDGVKSNGAVRPQDAFDIWAR
jgi:hypothetical protein